MLSSAFCFLLASQAIAMHNNPYGSYDMAPDYIHPAEIIPSHLFGLITAKDMKKPETKFTYNFEQLRKDQPPQLEIREEDLRKYKHRPPVTTTTKPVAAAVQFIQNLNQNPKAHGQFLTPISVLESESKHQHTPQPISTLLPLPTTPKFKEVQPLIHNWNNWDYQSIYPRTMPPPPSNPNWEELRKNLHHHAHSSTYSQHGHAHHHAHAQHSPSPAQHEIHSNQKHVHPASPVLPKYSLFTLNNYVPKPITSEVNSTPKEEFSGQDNSGQAIPHNFRGNYKFNGNDLKTEPTEIISTTTAASINKNKNPPPVPTLSPWYDGYGK